MTRRIVKDKHSHSWCAQYFFYRISNVELHVHVCLDRYVLLLLYQAMTSDGEKHQVNVDLG